MGRDKALIGVDGQPLVLRSVDALSAAGADPVVVIGGDEKRLVAMGLTVVADRVPGGGPVQAILTALDATTGADLVMVLACDLVGPQPSSIRATIEALARHPEAEVAVPVVDGRRQWLHSCWRASSRVALELDWGRGERSIWRCARDLRIVDVAGLDPASLADADRPSDLPTR
jgi:molybdopterin-guanine dinucleotide biosynthesis protein A